MKTIVIPIGRKRRIVIGLQRQCGWDIYDTRMDQPHWCLHEHDAESVKHRLQEVGCYGHTDKVWTPR